MSRVVVLRPEPGATETIKRAGERGLGAIAIPLFAVEPLEWQAPAAGGFDAILLTSANGIRAGGEQLGNLRGLPVHAVGAATAEAAREAGFDIASTGDSGVERLLGSVEPDLRLLHLCGEDRVSTADARQAITALPVYRSRPVEPPPSLADAAGAVILLHSPRAAERLAELAGAQGLDKARCRLAAISAAAADAAGSGWERVEATERPTDDALLALAEQLCENRPQE